ncbi:MAG: cation diffusion facilitator family transporter [Blastocatellia bacterium]
MSGQRGHSHGHGHSHDHARGGDSRRLLAVLGLTFAYMLAEAIGGFFANSLALLSDAGHMLTDVVALLLAMMALVFAGRPATYQKTYGYYRLEILAALANGIALALISVGIFYEALQRLRVPEHVHGLEVALIATGGLIVNGISAWVLKSSAKSNMNMRGVFLHVAADALGSIGAMAAGALIWFKGVLVADPLISVAICVLIVYGSWQLIKDAVNVLLEGTPSHIDIQSVIDAMQRVEDVREVHDLHVWTISSGKDALSAHCRVQPGASHRLVLECLQDALRREFDIVHATIQIELEEEESAERKLYQISPRGGPDADETGHSDTRESAATRKG